MAIHLTPTELAREAGLERREVIAKCMELGVPIFQGRIDKTLFLASLASRPARPVRRRSAGHRLTTDPVVASRAAAVAGHRIASSVDRQEERTMEAGTAAPQATGSKTIADLLPHRGASSPATTSRSATSVDGEWHDVTFAEVGDDRLRDRPRPDRPRHRAGRARLHPLQHAPGVDLRSTSRSPRPARVVVPIYPTNSPEECEWVAGNSEAVAVVCEDAEQVAKIVAVRERLPDLRHLVVDRPRGRRGRRDLARRAARARPRARRRPSSTRAPTPSAPTTPSRSSTPRARPGPPKGCVLTHGNYRAVLDMVERARAAAAATTTSSTSSCRSPTPSRCSSSSARSTRARRSPTSAATRSRSSPSSCEVKPTYLPVGPAHLREALHARLSGQLAGRGDQGDPRGRRPRSATSRSAASRSRPSCSEQFAPLAAEGRRSCAPLRRPPARGRHRRGADRARRSSSSSTAAACRCSRATA